jgi:hypothetical protein
MEREAEKPQYQQDDRNSPKHILTVLFEPRCFQAFKSAIAQKEIELLRSAFPFELGFGAVEHSIRLLLPIFSEASTGHRSHFSSAIRQT